MSVLRPVAAATAACALVWLGATLPYAHAHGGAHGGNDDRGEARSDPIVLAPGYRALSYPAPEPGTYALPPLGRAGDGTVLDGSGHAHRLHDLLGDKIVVLSFVYRSCDDVNGCPLASFVLSRVFESLAANDDLRDQVRLITMSFDPRNDTPEEMRKFGDALRGRGANVAAGPEWEFLTTASQAELAPILEAYDQAVSRDRDESGRELGTFSHVLRVFLIDRSRTIRNIYSVSFLHPDTLVSDIRTLQLESTAGQARMARERTSAPTDAPPSSAAAAVTPAAAVPLGLPPLDSPEARDSIHGAPIGHGAVALGRRLFVDRRLSRNDTISCAMCHVPEQGFTSNELATAVGIEGRTVRRNAPTLYNVAYAQRLFHDGRESRLEQQIWGPLLAVNEMGNPSIGYVLDKVSGLDDYRAAFESVFSGQGLTMETLGAALGAYQRTLLSADSPFDRWYYGGQTDAISAGAKRGFALFEGRARCAECHLVGEDAALFTDQGFHNTGIGYARAMGGTPASRRVRIAPDTFVDVAAEVLAAASEPLPSDLGRYEITGKPADRWRYKTPTLRNVALTAPYMHDGSLATLRDVVAFYNDGGVPNDGLDPDIGPLGLSDAEVDDLVAFLETLTGSDVGRLVADARTVPIGDPN